ncbi:MULTISPECIES: pectate lyase family protein [Clostridium]|uniref:pectate lyase family protein n=1 Tax=Clostridium TaxID=1485 RepID=UPI0009C0144F|nr:MULTISPECIES: right-handed parallel beta-helix repeat-containing protein [Clostridium]PJI07555.1 pectate lyase [Clostridium sp. CT7]
MVKKFRDKNQIKTFSKRAMMFVLTASIIAAPTFSASASKYSKHGTGSAVVTTTNTSKTITKASAGGVETASVSILSSEGNLESAGVEWSPVQGASGYDVYYKSEAASDSEYKSLDDNLIRRYPACFRADVMGLAAGNYIVKVVPIVNNSEDISKEAVTKTISVKANKREGFAFSSASPMGTGSGGYNDDGTVKNGAEIIYISASNVNTVTEDVVTNAKGTKTTCTGLVNILAARQKGYDKTPLIIRMVGEIKAADITGLNTHTYVQLKGCYNVTFEGVGKDATAYGWGFLIRGARNVELRNVGIMLFGDDAISLDTDNRNIWIHNNDLFYGAVGHDADQVKGDGSCDIKQDSSFVTVSYNHFHDSGKCSLCGMQDTQNYYVTYHHNWFDHSDSRHPRIRVGSVHVYNNYFDGNAKYGVGVTKGASAFVEANYFRDCKHPMLSSLQGTDIFNNTKGGFSGEAGGMIKAYNNKIEGAEKLIYAQQDSTQFDAYLASSRNEAVPSTYKTLVGGTTYNNFDTSSIMYKYQPDSPEDVQSNVTTYAGRTDGGDLIYNFTDADDASAIKDPVLENKIDNYQSSLVSIGGKVNK